jgi:hypothetical protein
MLRVPNASGYAATRPTSLTPESSPSPPGFNVMWCSSPSVVTAAGVSGPSSATMYAKARPLRERNTTEPGPSAVARTPSLVRTTHVEVGRSTPRRTPGSTKAASVIDEPSVLPAGRAQMSCSPTRIAAPPARSRPIARLPNTLYALVAPRPPEVHSALAGSSRPIAASYISPAVSAPVLALGPNDPSITAADGRYVSQ